MTKPELFELVKTSFTFMSDNYSCSASYIIAFISFILYIMFTIVRSFMYVVIVYRRDIRFNSSVHKSDVIKGKIYRISKLASKFFYLLMVISFIVPTIILLLPIIASLMSLTVIFIFGDLSDNCQYLHVDNSDHTNIPEFPREIVADNINHFMDDRGNNTNNGGSRNGSPASQASISESPANQASRSESPTNQDLVVVRSGIDINPRPDHIGVGPHTYYIRRPRIPAWRYEEDVPGFPNFIRDLIYGPRGVPVALTDDLAMAQVQLERMMIAADAHDKMGYSPQDHNPFLFREYERASVDFRRHMNDAMFHNWRMRNRDVAQVQSEQRSNMKGMKGTTDFASMITFGSDRVNNSPSINFRPSS